MVEVVDPDPSRASTIRPAAPAGFLLAAWEHMKKHPRAQDKRVYQALRTKFSGIDIVPEVVRLAAMNLYLHGITGVETMIEQKDALLNAGSRVYDMILTNPPFGRKQSYRVVRDDGEVDTEREDYDRSDFFVTTSNKQLNFLQHIMSALAPAGEAAVVMPDNVLFEGGAGETIRRRLLRNFNFHTLLGCRPASSTSRASRRMCCSSTRRRRPTRRRPRPCGSTICEPTNDLRLKSGR